MFTKRNKLEDKKIDIGNLIATFNYEIKYLEEYISFTNELMSKKKNKIQDNMYSDTLLDPMNDSLIQQIFENEGKYILSYYHHSAVVLIYSVLESVLSDICEEVNKITCAKFSFNDLSGGNIIKKAKYYLEITSGLDFSLISGEWAEIGKFQNLRNVIVHQNSSFTGSIDSIDKQKQKIRNNFPEIDISSSSNRFYILNDSLLKKFINLIKSFLSKLFIHVQNITFQIEIKTPVLQDINDDIPF